MKAVILAGGNGKRLRPLTLTQPKPMTSLLGKPVLHYIISQLKKSSVSEAILTLRYMPDSVISYLTDEYLGVNIRYYVEEQPRGTAGGLRHISGLDDDFIVLSGDAVNNFNLSEMIAMHKASGCLATICCTEVDDPREYGIVKIDENGFITSFNEKPNWNNVTSIISNTGIYIFSPKILSLIPDSGEFDFAHDLFPAMLTQKIPIKSYIAKGYWCDIGDISAFKRCQRDILSGKFNISEGDMINNRDDSFSCEAPVYIGFSTAIGEGAVIGKYSVINDNAVISKNARIFDSTIMQGAYVGENSVISDSIVCQRAVIKKDCDILAGSVIGAQCVIAEGSAVGGSAVIEPGKYINKYSVISADTVLPDKPVGLFEGDKITGTIFSQISPSYAAKLGAAIGSIYADSYLGLSDDGSAAARITAGAVMSGIASCGAFIWDFGSCLRCEHNYLLSYSDMKAGIYVCTDANDITMYISGSRGFPAKRTLLRKISAILNSGDFLYSTPKSLGGISDMAYLTQMYKRDILEFITVDSFHAPIECENNRQRNIASAVFKTEARTDKFSFQISDSGCRLSAKLEDSNICSYEHLLVLCCFDEFRKGKDVTIPATAPNVIDRIAKQYGCTSIRYSTEEILDSLPDDESESSFPWVNDAFFMIAKIMNIIGERSLSLNDLLKEIPVFFIYEKTMNINNGPGITGKIIKRLTDNPLTDTSDGSIRYVSDKGQVTAVPEDTGNKFLLRVEAFDAETAEELYFDVESIISSPQTNTPKDYKEEESGLF